MPIQSITVAEKAFEISRTDVGEAAKLLESLEVESILSGAFRTFGTRALVSTAFGPSGLCLVDLARRAYADTEVFTIDTGFLFEETYALVEEYESERKLKLRKHLPVLSPDEQRQAYGEALWERDPDLCCKLRKVDPNDQALENADLWITALRRDASTSRAQTPILGAVTLGTGRRILKLAPMVRWTLDEVWDYIRTHALPYNTLHDRGYPSVGCRQCTQPVAKSAPERAGRWAGQGKTECGLHRRR